MPYTPLKPLFVFPISLYLNETNEYWTVRLHYILNEPVVFKHIVCMNVSLNPSPEWNRTLYCNTIIYSCAGIKEA